MIGEYRSAERAYDLDKEKNASLESEELMDIFKIF